MKTKTIIAVFALSLAPSLAFAGCAGGHAQNVSCPVETVWDASSGTCVATPTG